MNKTTLAEFVAKEAGLKKKDAEKAVNAVFAAIENELATGGRVQLAGFGTFKVKERAERIGRNPKTMEEIQVPASRAAGFRAGKELKKAVSEGE